MEAHKPQHLVSVEGCLYPSLDQLRDASLHPDKDVHTRAIDSLNVVMVYYEWWKKLEDTIAN